MEILIGKYAEDVDGEKNLKYDVAFEVYKNTIPLRKRKAAINEHLLFEPAS